MATAIIVAIGFVAYCWIGVATYALFLWASIDGVDDQDAHLAGCVWPISLSFLFVWVLIERVVLAVPLWLIRRSRRGW